MIFVYRPCELALHSVSHGTNNKRVLITKDRMLSGGEAVGICVEGRHFSPVHVETALSYDEKIEDSPSILLVSASLYAAIRYAINHPKEGILFPEHTDSEEIISYVSKFLPVTITRL